jgi:hypothetical protein
MPKAENTAAIFYRESDLLVRKDETICVAAAMPMTGSGWDRRWRCERLGDPAEICGFHPDQGLFDADAQWIRDSRTDRGLRPLGVEREPAVEVGVRIEDPE